VDATKLALDEINGLVDRAFTEEELKRAKDEILSQFLFEYDTKEKVLAERERLEFYGYPADYLEKYEAAIRKVTIEDLTTAAKKYVHPHQLAILVVGNQAEIKPSLDELGLGTVHSIDITIPGAAGGSAAGETQKEQ
jgi:zinc protease